MMTLARVASREFVGGMDPDLVGRCVTLSMDPSESLPPPAIFQVKFASTLESARRSIAYRRSRKCYPWAERLNDLLAQGRLHVPRLRHSRYHLVVDDCVMLDENDDPS